MNANIFLPYFSDYKARLIPEISEGAPYIQVRLILDQNRFGGVPFFDNSYLLQFLSDFKMVFTIEKNRKSTFRNI